MKNVETHSASGSLETDEGETIRARSVADASGGGHVLSRMWNLRPWK